MCPAEPPLNDMRDEVVGDQIPGCHDPCRLMTDRAAVGDLSAQNLAG
jgi:hypothetical protein